MRTAKKAIMLWLTSMTVRLGKVSLRAPASGVKSRIGRNCSPVTRPSACAELSVSSVSTTQSWATRPIQVPVLETIAPAA